MQAGSDNLTHEITEKVDQVVSLQTEVTGLIENVSSHIDTFEVVNVDGDSSDMLLQKLIVSSNQLLDKVDALRDKIDAGEYDDRSNLGSILNSQMDGSEPFGKSNSFVSNNDDGSQVIDMNGSVETTDLQ